MHNPELRCHQISAFVNPGRDDRPKGSSHAADTNNNSIAGMRSFAIAIRFPLRLRISQLTEFAL